MKPTITAFERSPDRGKGLARDTRIRWALEEVGLPLMVSVLQRAKSTGLVDEFPNLAAYVARGEARPAYQRAFAAQLAVFRAAEAWRINCDERAGQHRSNRYRLAYREHWGVLLVVVNRPSISQSTCA